MKIYLDVCCLNRPFDNQAQNRVAIEAAAMVRILELIETVDDNLLKRAKKLASHLGVRVSDPISFLKEIKDEHDR